MDILKLIYNNLVFIVAFIGTMLTIIGYVSKLKTMISKPLDNIINKVDEIDNKMTLVSSGLKSQLRQSILKTCEDAIEKGYCSLENKKSLERTYEDYEKLVGENGLVDNMYKKTLDLPLKERVRFK